MTGVVLNAAEATAEPGFEGPPLADPSEPVYDQGLTFDVETLLHRRQLLRGLGYAGLAAGLFGVAACTVNSGGTPSGSAGGTLTGTPVGGSVGAAACAVIPEETAGPFPGDGSNGPDILTQSGVVRSDIRSSFGTSTKMAAGVPLTIRLAIQDLGRSCAPLAGAAVYIWHCDRDGQYSMYGQGVQNENYLRGVQAAGTDGVVTFSSIFPGCYSGRWAHIHFEVYPSLEVAANATNRIATSQIALPEAACRTVYATAGYAQSITNLGQVSLASDNVFGDDGGVHELGTVTGDVAGGLSIELVVPVKGA